MEHGINRTFDTKWTDFEYSKKTTQMTDENKVTTVKDALEDGKLTFKEIESLKKAFIQEYKSENKSEAEVLEEFNKRLESVIGKKGVEDYKSAKTDPVDIAFNFERKGNQITVSESGKGVVNTLKFPDKLNVITEADVQSAIKVLANPTRTLEENRKAEQIIDNMGKELKDKYAGSVKRAEPPAENNPNAPTDAMVEAAIKVYAGKYDNYDQMYDAIFVLKNMTKEQEVKFRGKPDEKMDFYKKHPNGLDAEALKKGADFYKPSDMDVGKAINILNDPNNSKIEDFMAATYLINHMSEKDKKSIEHLLKSPPPDPHFNRNLPTEDAIKEAINIIANPKKTEGEHNAALFVLRNMTLEQDKKYSPIIRAAYDFAETHPNALPGEFDQNPKPGRIPDRNDFTWVLGGEFNYFEPGQELLDEFKKFPGDSYSSIGKFQKFLKENGAPDLEIDGQIGPKTLEALAKLYREGSDKVKAKLEPIVHKLKNYNNIGVMIINGLKDNISFGTF